jgi:hypothetical protein
MNLDLSDDEAAALTQELHDIVENDRYPFSPRSYGAGKATLQELADSYDRSISTMRRNTRVQGK